MTSARVTSFRTLLIANRGEIVARVARRLGALRTGSVALELMNEPDGGTPAAEARWQRTLEDLHAAARCGLGPVLGGGWSPGRAP